MGVSYQNLLDLSEYISNGGSGSTYEHKYADRSDNNNLNHKTPIGVDDVNALLNALASNENDPDWSWVGNNCSYTQGQCIDGVKNISVNNGSYSKCNYDGNSDDSYIIENVAKPYDCPSASSCGSDVGYYWKVQNELETIYNNATGYTSNYKEIVLPGRCEKRYLGNRDGSETTTTSDDPFKSGSASDNGVYNCMTYGELIDNTEYPVSKNENGIWVTNHENGYKITNDSGVYEINKECANNSIHYGDEWDENNMNDGYNSKGMTNPNDPTLGYFGGGTNEVSGQTRPCAINRLQSKYVKKGDYETNNIIKECSDTDPLYPGSDAVKNMDVPSDDAAQWWNENSCIWVHFLNTQGDTIANDGTVYFEPAILNGKCTFGDFTIPDPDGWLYTKDTGSHVIGSNGIDENNTPKIFSHSFTHDEFLSQSKYGSSSESDIEYIIPHYDPPKTPSSPDEKRCSWVPNDDTIQGGNGNALVPDVPDVSDSFNAQDITGKFKKYSKDTSTQPYSLPYTIGSNNIVLDKNNYRAHGYFGNDDTMATDCPNLNNQPNPFNFNTQSTDIKWLSGSDVNKINEGSNLITNDPRIKKINLEDSELTDIYDGVGSGECWQKVELTSVPNYVQYKAPIKGDDNPLFENEQISMDGALISQTLESPLNIQNELLLNHIPSYGSDNEELIYKNMALMNDGDSVFFKRDAEDCAAADNDQVSNALSSLEYAWIN